MNEMLKLAANARIMDELAAEGLNVALPLEASDIDIVAIIESPSDPRRFAFVPIHIVMSQRDKIATALRAACIAEGLTALVWDLGKGMAVQSFALTSAELTAIKGMKRIDGTEPKLAGRYDETRCQDVRETVLYNAIKPFAMAPGRWRKKLLLVALQRELSVPAL